MWRFPRIEVVVGDFEGEMFEAPFTFMEVLVWLLLTMHCRFVCCKFVD